MVILTVTGTGMHFAMPMLVSHLGAAEQHDGTEDDSNGEEVAQLLL